MWLEGVLNREAVAWCVKGLKDGRQGRLRQLKRSLRELKVQVKVQGQHALDRKRLQCRLKGQALSRPRHHQMHRESRLTGQAFGRPKKRHQTKRKCPVTVLKRLIGPKYRCEVQKLKAT